MEKQKKPLRMLLRPGWPQTVKSAMLHVISRAQFGMAYTRGWAVNSPIARVRLKAENDRLNGSSDRRRLVRELAACERGRHHCCGAGRLRCG